MMIAPLAGTAVCCERLNTAPALPPWRLAIAQALSLPTSLAWNASRQRPESLPVVPEVAPEQPSVQSPEGPGLHQPEGFTADQHLETGASVL
jgi:hypothetical protein